MTGSDRQALREQHEAEDAEAERLREESCECTTCGHLQTEPNWCHKCGHRTTQPPWAKRLLGELEAAKDEAEQAEQKLEQLEAGVRERLLSEGALDAAEAKFVPMYQRERATFDCLAEAIEAALAAAFPPPPEKQSGPSGETGR